MIKQPQYKLNMLYLQTEQSPEKTDSLSVGEPTAVPDSIIKTDTAHSDASPAIKHALDSPHPLSGACKGSDDLGGKCSTVQEINCQKKKKP